MTKTPTTPDPKADRTDLERMRAMTDAEIELAVSQDPDTFIPDARWMENARIVVPAANSLESR